MREKYEEILRRELTVFKELLSNDEGWQFLHEKDGVEIYTKSGTPTNYVKGIGYVKAKPEEIIKLLCTDDVNVRQKWDPSCIGNKIIESYTDIFQVGWVLFQSPSMMVSNRDFVFVRDLFKENENEQYLINKSVAHEKCPADQDGVVRAEIIVASWKFEYDEKEGRTKVTYINQPDLKGWVPTWVVNQTTTDQPLAIARLAKILEK